MAVLAATFTIPYLAAYAASGSTSSSENPMARSIRQQVEQHAAQNNGWYLTAERLEQIKPATWGDKVTFSIDSSDPYCQNIITFVKDKYCYPVRMAEGENYAGLPYFDREFYRDVLEYQKIRLGCATSRSIIG